MNFRWLNPLNWFRKTIANPTLIVEVLPDYTVQCNFIFPNSKSDNDLYQTADRCANLIIALSNGQLDSTLRNDLAVSAFKQKQVLVSKIALSLLEQAGTKPRKRRGPLIPPEQLLKG